MLIRIDGAKSGIKKYLVEGQKAGRELSRDELDERVILHGDLDMTNAIIESLDIQGERYLHITLSFKEDFISHDMLNNIVNEFETFTLSAYKKEEYNLYAEAHLPKIKSYLNKATGEMVERKPHIHLIIPKINLVSNTSLNPFGLTEKNIDYINAFQEHINNKYGLASPKDNLRTSFTSSSEIISRYKGDFFERNNKQLKEHLLEQVIDKKIETYDGFIFLLRELGEHKTRNAGHYNQYENLKKEGMQKGVNLKEPVFSKAFIELPTNEKIAKLKSDFSAKYHHDIPSKKDTNDITDTLIQWHSVRAMEVKYLNSGSSFYKKYFAADSEERHKLLSQQKERFYTKYQEPQNEYERQGKKGKQHGFEHSEARRYELDRYRQHDGTIDTPHRERHPVSLTERATATTTNGMPILPSGTVARHTPEREMLLSSDASVQLGQLTANGNNSLRWSNTSKSININESRKFYGRQPLSLFLPPDFEKNHSLNKSRSIHTVRDLSDVPSIATLNTNKPHKRTIKSITRKSDNVVSQLSRDLVEQQQIGAYKAEFHHIKQHLDASRLLTELSSSHGVVIEKYSVMKSGEGDRIQCGNRHLNVSDFLTKEMHLPWREAEGILRQSYAWQYQQSSHKLAQQQPDPVLWKAFIKEHVDHSRVEEKWALQKESEQQRRVAINLTYQSLQSQARSLPKTEKYLAVKRATELVKAQRSALRQTMQEERKTLCMPMIERYRSYLVTKAKSDPLVLAELRRMRFEQPSKDHGDHYITGTHPDEKNEIIAWPKKMAYVISENGDVTYFVNDKQAVIDEGDRLKFVGTDTPAIEAGLLLAQQKFGVTINLSGTTEFKEKSAQVAAECEMNIKFTDHRLNDIVEARRAEVFSEKMQYQELAKVVEYLQNGAIPQPEKDLSRDIQKLKQDRDIE